MTNQLDFKGPTCRTELLVIHRDKEHPIPDSGLISKCENIGMPLLSAQHFITPVVISFRKQLEVVKTKREIDGMMLRCHRKPEARKGPGLCGALAGTGKTITP